MEMQQPDVMPADPVHRRRTLLALLLVGVIGIASIVWLLPLGERALLAARDTGRVSSRTICLAFLGVVGLLALPVTIAGGQAMRIGGLVVSSEQFPAPGQKVIRDTRILRGRQAVTIGKVQRILGALLIACAAMLVALSAYAAILLL